MRAFSRRSAGDRPILWIWVWKRPSRGGPDSNPRTRCLRVKRAMADLSQLRIGYVPYRAALSGPGDRRRFAYYARKRNLRLEIANPGETYDLVYVTLGGDVTAWADYSRGNAKVVYEQIDSYLAVPRMDPKAVVRGI